MGRSSEFRPIKPFWLAHREPRLDRAGGVYWHAGPLPCRGARMTLPGGAH
jgi:hypothetical protein